MNVTDYTVCNGDTAYVTQLNRKNRKVDITERHTDIKATCCKRNITLFDFSCLVV